MAARKRKHPDGCGCVGKINKAAEKQGFELVTSFTLSGRVWPSLETRKVEGASPRAPKPPRLIPSFCPFCGKKYPEAA